MPKGGSWEVSLGGYPSLYASLCTLGGTFTLYIRLPVLSWVHWPGTLFGVTGRCTPGGDSSERGFLPGRVPSEKGWERCYFRVLCSEGRSP